MEIMMRQFWMLVYLATLPNQRELTQSHKGNNKSVRMQKCGESVILFGLIRCYSDKTMNN